MTSSTIEQTNGHRLTMADEAAVVATPASPEVAPEFLEQLAARLERGGRAAAIFGPVVERDGVTIIPVARAGWGVGGGQGKSKDAEAGSGGGGGVSTVPAGFIEIRGGRATFKPIMDPVKLARVAFGFALLVMLVNLLLQKKFTTAKKPEVTRVLAVNNPLGNLYLPVVQAKSRLPMDAGFGNIIKAGKPRAKKTARWPFIKTAPENKAGGRRLARR